MKSKRGRPVGSINGRNPMYRGGEPTKAAQAWRRIQVRCDNPKCHIFRYYGGRGIKVCEEWKGRSGFDNFVEHVGEPIGNYWIGRIDNERGYEPGNVRWETPKEQAQNRRKTGKITDGSLRQLALAAGLRYHVVYFRIHRLGWSKEKALSTPIAPRGRKLGWRKRPLVYENPAGSP